MDFVSNHLEMVDVLGLPYDLQESIWTEYHDGLRKRLDRYRRWLMHNNIRALCQDDASFNHVLDWMAHTLQYPHVKPRRAIVLVGPPGCGKDLFVKLLTLLLGRDKVTSGPRGRFNGELEGALVACFDDCNVRKELPHINALVSDNHITIERHFAHPYIVPSYHRVLVITNVPLSPLLQHSVAFLQRFTVISCGIEQGGDFHDAIHDSARVDALRRYLMDRPVPHVL